MLVDYDAGTILFDSKPEGFPDVKWDPRVKRWRAPACLWHRTLRSNEPSLHDEFIVKLFGSLAPAQNVPRLRDYQNEALMHWISAQKRGLVSLPTGSGKTIVALKAVEICRCTTLILVPTRVLLHQWRQNIQATLGVIPGVYGDGEHCVATITVATFESAWRHAPHLGDRFGLVIIDEAHHFGVGKRDEALEMLMAPWRLGLSATPPQEPQQQRRFEFLVGPTVFSLGVSDLAGGHLAPFRLFEVGISLTLQEKSLYDSYSATFKAWYSGVSSLLGETNWSSLCRFARSTPEGRRAMAQLRAARDLAGYPHGKRRVLSSILTKNYQRKGLLFTHDTETAYLISREFLIPAITSEITGKERKFILDTFRDGGYNFVVSCRVLNEGVDVPSADLAVIIGGSSLEREHIQRIGRALRPYDGKEAHIIELVSLGTREERAAKKRGKTLSHQKEVFRYE